MAEGSGNNDITRKIKFEVDKDAAKQAQNDAREVLRGMEKDGSAVKQGIFQGIGHEIARGVGRAIAGFIGFFKEAVDEAIAAEAAWSKLEGTLLAVDGTIDDDLLPSIRAVGAAFADATVHTQTEFVDSLSRLIALTGDTSASLNNMGMIANVAAQFFGGDLAAATEVVGKVMNGNTKILKQMGIAVDSAQEGLEVLAQRSFGMAERYAATFAGQLREFPKIWDDIKESIGNAVVSNENATGALTVLRGVLIEVKNWVAANEDTIRSWVTRGLMFAIDAADVLFRALKGMAELLAGAFRTAWGGGQMVLVGFGKAVASVYKAYSAMLDLLGVGDADARKKRLQAIEAETDALLALAQANIDAGAAVAKSGLATLSRKAFTSADVVKTGQNTKREPLAVNAPQLGRNAVPGELDDAAKALEKYRKSVAAAETQSALLGPSFDLLAAKASALETVLKELGEAGWDEGSRRMRAFAAELLAVNSQMGEAEFAKHLGEIDRAAMLLGADFDAVGAKVSLFEDRIQDLIAEGADPAGEKLKALRAELKQLQEQAASRNAFKTFEDNLKALDFANLLAGGLDEMGNPLDPWTDRLQGLKGEIDAVTSSLMTMKEEGVSETDPLFVSQLERLDQLRGAYRKVAEEAKLMGDVATLAGDIVAAAMGAGIVPFAKMKAKQAAIESAENAVRAVISALSPFGQAAAAKHAMAAAKFAAIAGAWSALAHSGVGGGGVSGGGAGGSSASSASSASSRTTPADTEVHIYLEGDLDAFNPVIQKKLYVAGQEARERYGDNAKVRLHRRSAVGG